MFGGIARGIASLARGISRIVSRVQRGRLDGEDEPTRRRYKVSAVRDSKTCAVCRRKDGTTVTVQSNDSVETIVKRLREQVPPFHPNCRCILEQVGTQRS